MDSDKDSLKIWLLKLIARSSCVGLRVNSDQITKSKIIDVFVKTCFQCFKMLGADATATCSSNQMMDLMLVFLNAEVAPWSVTEFIIVLTMNRVILQGAT